jgi:hypothetical protein
MEKCLGLSVVFQIRVKTIRVPMYPRIAQLKIVGYVVHYYTIT